MFIRKKRNKSGSYSVLLLSGERMPGKKHPTSTMIKCFGTTYDEKELKFLLEQAETYKAQLQVCFPKPKILKINSENDLKSCRSYNVGFSDVYGHAFIQAFNTLNFNKNLLDKLKDLVIMRIADPASKRRTAALSIDYDIVYNVDSIYKLMDKVTSPVITNIKKAVYNHTAHLLSKEKMTIDILFYDLTTIYFETNSQDEVRDFGFSKDGKHQHVQIMLAVIVTKDGLPVDYEEFAGNAYEGHTLIPVIEKIKIHYNIDNVVIVADAALMNAINLQALEDRKIRYIISARIKNTKKIIKQSVLDLDSYQEISNIKDLKGTALDKIKAKIIDTDTGDILIAYHSTKRARKDAHDRQKSIEKIKKHVSSTAKSKLTGALRKAYVKINKECKIEIDQDKLNAEEQYDGFFGLRTNIKNAQPKEILLAYRGLWQVEQTFRIAKSSLEIRPVFHYSLNRIRAHFAICYMALALIRYVEFSLKRSGLYIPCEQLHLMLRKVRKVVLLNSREELFEILEDPPDNIAPIYHALDLKWHKKFQFKPQL